MKQHINQGLATHLREVRKRRGHTLGDVQDLTGADKSQVSRWESGETIIPGWFLVAYNLLELKNE